MRDNNSSRNNHDNSLTGSLVDVSNDSSHNESPLHSESWYTGVTLIYYNPCTL